MSDEKIALLKASPAIGGTLLSSLTLNDWVMIATLVYVVAQIGLLVPRYWAAWRRWRARA